MKENNKSVCPSTLGFVRSIDEMGTDVFRQEIFMAAHDWRTSWRKTKDFFYGWLLLF